MEAFSRQFLNEGSDITRSEEIVEGAKLIVKAMGGIAARTTKADMGSASGIFPDVVTPKQNNSYTVDLA